MTVTNNPAWQALAGHSTGTLRELFAQDPGRGSRMVVEAAGLALDYSKQRVTAETIDLLVALADAVDLAGHREAMFRGDHINTTEDRAVLHTALRLPREATLVVDGVDVVAEVHAVLDRMAAFSDKVRSGQWTGHTGKPIRNVVNIGIGGSDLGPVMAYEALKHYSRPRHDLPVRLQRRRHRLRRGGHRPRPGGDAVHRLVEDLHHPGDDEQRALRTDLAARGPGRRVRGGQALRRGVDQRRGGVRVRHRHRANVRLLGLGGRSLLDGLGHRAVDDAGHRPGQLRRHAGRLPRDGRALPHRAHRREPAGADGLAVGVEPELPRPADLRGAAVRAVPQAFPRLPAAADHGVQRQVGAARRAAGGLRDGRDLLGRAGHQRPALVLPADPPGHVDDRLRLHVLPRSP